MTRLARDQVDPTIYWDGDNFKAYSFAEELVDIYEIATTVETDMMYWHNGRTWHRWGEQTLRSEIRGLLRDAANRELVNETIRNVKHLTRRQREDIFDLPPEKIVVENGVVDLLTGEFTSDFDHPGTQTWLPVEYEEGAVPERFNDFLFDVLHPDDVSVMWELIGYTLYRGYPFQKAALFLGEGANGKSTLLNALREFLGDDNVSSVELQDFADNRFAAADMEGKLANVAADLSDSELEQTGTFKELTGGDKIRAERKYEASFQFENTATLIFSANQAPAAEDETYAYKRRWLYFDFPNTFSGEDAVPQRDLLEQFSEEQAGILNMAIEHFGDLWARGGFGETVYQREHDDAHDRATNPAHTFATDKMVEAGGEVLRKTDARDAFREWCEETGRTKQGNQALDRAIRSVHSPDEGKDPADRRYKAWFGVNLGGPDDDTTDATGDVPPDASIRDFKS